MSHMNQYPKQTLKRTYLSTWTEFEKKLIDFVRDHPVIYDVKADDEITHVIKCDKLWTDFAKKWYFSAVTCKRRWKMIRSAYMKLKANPKNNVVSLCSYKRLTDGRLSFLDHLRSTELNTQPSDVNSETSDPQTNSDSNIIEIVLSDDEKSPLQMTSTDNRKTEQPLSKILESTIDVLFKGKSIPTDTNRTDSGGRPSKRDTKIYRVPTKKKKKQYEKHPIDHPQTSSNLNNDEVIMLSDEDDAMESTNNDNFINKEQPFCKILNNIDVSHPNVVDSEMIILKPIDEQLLNEEKKYTDPNNQDDIMLTGEQDPLETKYIDNSNVDQPLGQKLETTVSDRPKVVVTEIRILKPTDKQPIHEIPMNTESNSNQEIFVSSDYETLFTKKNDNILCDDTQSQNPTVTDRLNDVMKVIKNNNIMFSYFEIRLINYAEKHPVLYETRDFQDDPARRKRVKFLWEKFAETFYPPIEAKRMSTHCHNIWNRIRLEYFVVYKLIDENMDIKLGPPLSKYVGGRLSFLKEMYDYVKTNNLRIYYKGTGSTEDNGYLEACSETIPFDWVVIHFVKRFRILYDKRSISKKASSNLTLARGTRMLWEELAVNLNTSRMDCEESWSQTLINYLNFVRSTRIKQKMKIPSRFNDLSFLNEVYDIVVEYDDDTKGRTASSLTNNTRDIKINGKKKRSVKKKNTVSETMPILEDLAEKEVRCKILGILSNATQSPTIIEQTDIKKVTQTVSTFEELIGEWDDNLENETQSSTIIEQADKKEVTRTGEWDENLETHKNKTRSPTTIDQSNQKEIPITSDNEYYKTTEEIKSKSNIDLSLENENFFRAVGKYITDSFPEKIQKEIQVKAWALVTQLQLEMLEED